MRPRIKLIIAVVLPVISTIYFSNAKADDEAPADQDRSQILAGKLSLGVGIGYERFDTNLKITDKSTNRDVFVDLESTLGLAERRAIPLIYGYYRPSKKHGFGWSYARIRRDGNVASVDENFGDLNVTGNVSISDRTSFYYVSYNYTAYEDERAFVFISLGLYGLDLAYNLNVEGDITYQDMPLASGVYEQEISQFAPLPLIGIDTWFALTPKWAVGAKVSVVGGTYEDLSAFVMSSKIRATYALSERFAIDFGVNYFDADITIDDSVRRSDIRYGFSGFIAGLSYRF